LNEIIPVKQKTKQKKQKNKTKTKKTKTKQNKTKQKHLVEHLVYNVFETMLFRLKYQF